MTFYRLLRFVLVGAAGFLMIVTYSPALWSNVDFLIHSVVVRAHVIDNHLYRYNSDQDTCYAPVLSYTTVKGSIVHTQDNDDCGSQRVQVGQVMTIRYRSDDPRTIHSSDIIVALGNPFWIVGSGVIIELMFLAVLMWRFRRKIWRRRTG